jgi:hypothetical protein
MPTFPIDATRATLIATGKSTPVLEWIEGAARGAVRPQQRDENSGLLLWVVDVLIDDDDATRAAVAGVQVPSLDAPVVQKFRPVAFTGLRVDVYVQRATGALVCRWTADGIENGKPASSSVA